ncbi:MAG: bacillithiol system redox-active protein YtxJ [Flavobacteriales bacterium]|nr:bacillithiol system redox-active protein YtxJ [Flavobacteriales bacterium]
MNWHVLESMDDWNTALERSHQRPIAIFKHSTRCPVSMMVRRQVENAWDIPEDHVVPYFLDLIAHRDVSNAIASETGVWHESPQLILIKNGTSVYDADHNYIEVREMKKLI